MRRLLCLLVAGVAALALAPSGAQAHGYCKVRVKDWKYADGNRNLIFRARGKCDVTHPSLAMAVTVFRNARGDRPDVELRRHARERGKTARRMSIRIRVRCRPIRYFVRYALVLPDENGYARDAGEYLRPRGCR